MNDNLPPGAAATAKAADQAAALKQAQLLAAKGGWPRNAYCSLSRRKTAWAWTIATFFGAGFGKPGPGTWGSVGATLIWSAAAMLLNPSPNKLLAWTVIGIVLSIGLGVPAATIAARESGRKDPGFVVIDEVAGVWITLLPLTFLSRNAGRPDWEHILAALLLFRVFDITKPFPVRNLEKLPEGWGIVFDDVAAGLYAGAVLLLLMTALHWK